MKECNILCSVIKLFVLGCYGVHFGVYSDVGIYGPEALNQFSIFPVYFVNY